MNTIRKFVLAVVVMAVATSFLPTSSFANKSAKERPCSVGRVCMNKPDKKGWGTVMRCTYDRKMIGDFSPCNVRSGYVLRPYASRRRSNQVSRDRPDERASCSA
jgi:hypothetical protein